MLKMLTISVVIFAAAYFILNNSSGNLFFNKNPEIVPLSKIITNPDFYNKKVVFTKGYPSEYFSILGTPYILVKDKDGNKVLLKAINHYEISDSIITIKVRVNSLLKVNNFGLLYLEEVK